MEPKIVTIKQNELTAECWLVQFQGFSACETCEVKDTKECGGSNIRKTKKNEKGFSIPLKSCDDSFY